MPGIKNVLFVDSSLVEHKLFVESSNSSTFPIVYSSNTSRNEIVRELGRFGGIERVAFVFHESGPTYRFLNSEPLFLEGEQVYNSANVRFIVDMANRHNVKNIDFLACNTLRYPAWRAYYDVLEKHTRAVVGASDDETGNLKYGGDWLMESSQENVKNVYFTSSISNYSSLLNLSFSSFVIANGVVLASGSNYYGELGMGDDVDLNVFTEVSSLGGKQVVRISGGHYYNAAIDVEGKTYVVGHNLDGQLGMGNNVDVNVFTEVSGLAGVNAVEVSCGNKETLVLASDGKVYATGDNTYGQLGMGNKVALNVFTEVSSLAGINVVEVSCGAFANFVRAQDGKVYAAGSNYYGELGMGNNVDLEVFTEVSSLAGINVVGIRCGFTHVLVLAADGKVYATGRNSYGTLGMGNYDNLDVFTEVSSLAGINVVSISCLGFASLALGADGKVYATGSNAYGDIGTGAGDLNVFTEVTGLANVNVSEISSGRHHSFALRDDGVLYVTGRNTYGALGTGNNDDLTTFTEVTPLPTVTYIADMLLAPEVGTAAGYATEIADEVPTYQNLTPSPSDLQTSSSNKVANAQAVNYDTNMSVPELEGKKPTIQGYLNEITPLKTTLEGYLTNINGVLETYNTYEDQMTEWVNNDPNLSQSDKTAIQEYLTNLQASGNTLLNIKTNIENAITAVSGDITTVNGILSDIDAKIAVVTSTGYTNTISSELTGQENLSPSPTALETEANGIITSAGSIVSKTTTPADILQSNYDTVQGYYNTITLSKTTLEGYLVDIDSVIANGNTYKTAMSGYLADASITGTDRSSIQSSYDSVSNNVTSLGGIKTTIESSLASVSADAVTIGALFTQVGGVLNAVVCFPGDTPVTTDQGEIKIKELVAGKHTIDGKRIKYITKVRNEDSTLTCIRRNAIDEGVPNRKTLITNEHPVEFHGEMVQAGELVDMVDGAFKVKYNGEPVYNVVMDKKDTMMVNGLRCETLDPKSRCLLAMMMCERVMNEQEPAKKVRLGMGLRNVLKKMKLEDIRKRRGPAKN